ncbi:MAG: LamG domain-containing protein [Treponema sp.]|jgi:hypothetical protein|nr:LamG domain-containing protein [Treponema sp.]
MKKGFYLIAAAALALCGGCSWNVQNKSDAVRAADGKAAVTVNIAQPEARTLLPAETVLFSRYVVTITADTGNALIPPAPVTVTEGANAVFYLPSGAWIASVDGYRYFTVNGTEAEYKTASGSASFTVNDAEHTKTETVHIVPSYGTGGGRGIFAYNITLPDPSPAVWTQAVLTLTTSAGAPVESGAFDLALNPAGSMELPPGNYKLGMRLEKSSKETYGEYWAVQVYAYMTTTLGDADAPYDLDDAVFVSAVRITGTAHLSTAGQVRAYSDSSLTQEITAAAGGRDGAVQADHWWTLDLPAQVQNTTVYLMLTETVPDELAQAEYLTNRNGDIIKEVQVGKTGAQGVQFLSGPQYFFSFDENLANSRKAPDVTTGGTALSYAEGRQGSGGPKAASFAADSYLQLEAARDTFNWKESFTIAFWVNTTTSSTSSMTIFANREYVSSNSSGRKIRGISINAHSTGNGGLSSLSGDGNAVIGESNLSLVPSPNNTNRWNHIAAAAERVTAGGDTWTVTFYANGERVGGPYNNIPYLFEGSASLSSAIAYIGKSADAASGAVFCMQDFLLVNAALNAADIAALVRGAPAALSSVVNRNNLSGDVTLQLTNSPAYPDGGAWKLYVNAEGDAEADGVTVVNVGNTLTLSAAGGVPPGEYYLAYIYTPHSVIAPLAAQDRLAVTAAIPVTEMPMLASSSVQKTAAEQASMSMLFTNVPAYVDGTVLTVYAQENGADLAEITASYLGSGNFTLNHETNITAGTYWISAKEPYSSESGARFALTVTDYAAVSRTPTITPASVEKSAGITSSVAFTLTNSPVYAPGAVWTVWDAPEAGSQIPGMQALSDGTVLTLSGTGGDIPEGTFYLQVTEYGKTEPSEERAEVTVTGIPVGIVRAEVRNAASGMVRVTFNQAVSVDASHLDQLSLKVNVYPTEASLFESSGTKALLDFGVHTTAVNAASVLSDTHSSVWDFSLSIPAAWGEILRFASTGTDVVTSVTGDRALPIVTELIVKNSIARLRADFENAAGFYRTNGELTETIIAGDDGTLYQSAWNIFGDNDDTDNSDGDGKYGPAAGEILTIVLEQNQTLTDFTCPWTADTHRTLLKGNAAGATVIVTRKNGLSDPVHITINSDMQAFSAIHSIRVVLDDGIIIDTAASQQTGNRIARLASIREGGVVILDGGILHGNINKINASNVAGVSGISLTAGAYGAYLIINSGGITDNTLIVPSNTNTSASYALSGGILVENYGVTVMNGGEISGNTLQQDRAARSIRGAGFTSMVTSSGSGNIGSAAFYMTDGLIQNNRITGTAAEVASAGGVIIGGTFQKTGGTITGAGDANANSTTQTGAISAGAAAVLFAAGANQSTAEAKYRDGTTGVNDQLFYTINKKTNTTFNNVGVPLWCRNSWD